MCNDVVSAAAAVLQNLHFIKSRCVHNKESCIFTICNVTSGHTYNVFPDEAFMQGTMRTYDENVLKLMKEKIRTISTHTAEALGCKAEVEIIDHYPAVINHAKETDHVVRLAKKWFGEEHFSEEDVPLAASEDFSYFLLEKPGCFWMLGTKKPNKPIMTLHTSNYDYNDNLLASGGYLYLRLVEDRLGIRIL